MSAGTLRAGNLWFSEDGQEIRGKTRLTFLWDFKNLLLILGSS